MSVPSPIHSSKSDEWCTPPEIFDPLNVEFRFDIDLAAKDPSMSRCQNWLSEAEILDWKDLLADGYRTGWCNPPYSDDEAFIREGAEAARHGFASAHLVFAKTDVAWWHEVVMKEADEVRLIKGRVRFIAGEDMWLTKKGQPFLLKKGERGDPAPKGSCVVVFRPTHERLYPSVRFSSMVVG